MFKNFLIWESYDLELQVLEILQSLAFQLGKNVVKEDVI